MMRWAVGIILYIGKLNLIRSKNKEKIKEKCSEFK